MFKKIYLSSLKETKKAAQEVAGEIKPQDVLAFYGDLGAGKTTFIQFLAHSLGIKGTITSPTFNILKEYNIKDNTEIKRFYHIDCYRLSGEKEILDLGFKELISDREGVVAIEWADKIENILPEGYIKIRLKYKEMGREMEKSKN